MINNKTQQNTNVNTGTKSESEIYLKKSELPKELSSFRNDVGYISESALASWMREHSYISKNEINNLISRANLVVIDTVNKSADSDAINRLNEDISNIKGEIVAIKDRFTDLDGKYISKTKERTFATNTDIRNLSDRIDNISVDIDTSQFVTKGEIPTKVSQLENDVPYLTRHQSLTPYAKKTDIPDVSEFVTKDEININLNGYAKESWVKSQGYLTRHQSLAEYVKKSEIDTSKFLTKDNIFPLLTNLDIATQDWVKSRGYLTKHQPLTDYVKKGEIPNITNLATKDEIPSVTGLISQTQAWVKDQGYLTKHQPLTDYVKKNELPDVSQFITKDEIPSVEGLATQEWVKSKNYLTEHQSLRAYAKKTDIPDTSNLATKDEIPSVAGLASQTWVKNQGYLTQHQSLNDYVKKGEIDTSKFLTKDNIFPLLTDLDIATQDWVKSKNYLTKNDLSGYVSSSSLANTLKDYARTSSVYSKNYIDTNFITKADAAKHYLGMEELSKIFLSQDDAELKYLQIEDYRGLKDASVISNTYINKTLTDLNKDLDSLLNGFYLVDHDDVVIVKDHEIISMFSDGERQRNL